jgi:hypothetical protein
MSVQPYLFNEGSISLALDSFNDLTVNTFVLEYGEKSSMNIMISRDKLVSGEDISAYVTRQIGVLGKNIKNHKISSRLPATLGSGKGAIQGEVIEATQKNSGKTFHQRQAGFPLPAPFVGRVLVFSVTQDKPFSESFNKSWNLLLESFKLRAADA